MATRQEITDTIQQGIDIVHSVYDNMTDAQAQTRVGGGDGWTAKEVLAHMAGRKPAYERLIQIAQGDSSAAFGGNIDPDARNEAIVSVRRDVPLKDIVAEYVTVHQWAIEQARTLPDAALAAIIPLPGREMPLSDLLKLAAGNHTLSHVAEVQAALAKG